MSHCRPHAALCAVFLLLIGVAQGRAGMRVVATFAPIYSLTANVTGTAAQVEMLLPPNAGPHDFALSPGDLRKITTADVIVSNGLGLEAWLDHALESGINSRALHIVASKGIAPRANPASIPPAPEADEEGPNPHVWLDPILAIKEVENIRDGLASKDPAHAADYRENAARYSARLRKLDEEIRAAASSLAEKRMVTFHDSFPYFAARYGFEIVGVFESFPGKDPSPRYLKNLRDLIVRDNVKVLFSEPQFSPQILRSLSDDLHIPVVVIDPMETGAPSAGLYEEVMRRNLRSLTEALK